MKQMNSLSVFAWNEAHQQQKREKKLNVKDSFHVNAMWIKVRNGTAESNRIVEYTVRDPVFRASMDWLRSDDCMIYIRKGHSYGWIKDLSIY